MCSRSQYGGRSWPDHKRQKKTLIFYLCCCGSLTSPFIFDFFFLSKVPHGALFFIMEQRHMINSGINWILDVKAQNPNFDI